MYISYDLIQSLDMAGSLTLRFGNTYPVHLFEFAVCFSAILNVCNTAVCAGFRIVHSNSNVTDVRPALTFL